MSEHEQTRLSPDDRYEMALASEASARRNRPSHLVVIAGMVFIVACAVLGVTSCRSSEAAADLDRRLSERATIADLLTELKALEGSEDTSDTAATQPYVGLRSKMEEIARQVGIEGPLAFPRERRSPDVVGAERVSYDYAIKGDSLGPLLAFVREATGQIPGMRVSGLTLRPRNNLWELDAKFERWERTSTP